MRRMKMMTTTGRIEGRVMYQICCSLRAPSMVAASYRSGSTPARAARKMMVPQPASFQMSVSTSVPRNDAGSISMLGATPMVSRSRLVMTPVCGARNTTARCPITTQDRKCGR